MDYFLCFVYVLATVIWDSESFIWYENYVHAVWRRVLFQYPHAQDGMEPCFLYNCSV